MPDSQIAQIKALEETMRQLIQQAGDMREEARKTEDPRLREAGARNLADGLRGMRESLQ